MDALRVGACYGAFGKTHLEEVWPNLEVFFHGGIAFTPYREQFEQLITKSDMHYMETYNASEGFSASRATASDRSMLLMLDYGVFYEFLPMDEFGGEAQHRAPQRSRSGKELCHAHHHRLRIMALRDRRHRPIHLHQSLQVHHHRSDEILY